MDDPLRKLFLDVGVDDEKGVAALGRVTAAANKTEKALLGVAQASKAAGSITTAVSHNNRLVSSYNAVARSANVAASALQRTLLMQAAVGRAGMAMGPSTGAIQAIRMGQTPFILERPGLAGAGALPFAVRSGGTSNAAQVAMAIRQGRQSTNFMSGLHTFQQRTGRGNFGLGTSIFLATAGAGAGAYGFRQHAGLERGSRLAAYASGQSPTVMAAQSRLLARQFNMRLGDATALTRTVSQLGVEGQEGRMELARAGAGFNVLEQTISAGEASEAIYRLIKATSRSREEMNAGTAAATRYASAIFAAGNESAAGAAAVFSMVKELEPLAQIMRLGSNGTIALSAAFADLNENHRELFRGALTRMVIEGKLSANDPIGSLLGIAERLRNATDDLERINILKALGFDNIRDVQTASVMAASLDTFARSLKAVNEELSGASTFHRMMQEVLGDSQGMWDKFTSSIDRASGRIVGSLVPALALVLGTLTGIAEAVAGNDALAMLFGFGAAGLAGMGLRRLYRKHLGGPAASAMLGEMLPFERRSYGARTRELSTFMPLPMAKRFGFSGFGARMAQGASLLPGGGRMNRLSLGLMRTLPFVGEGLAARASGAMLAGGAGGMAVKLATGPVGWIITALTLGAPLFTGIADALGGMAEKAGALGPALNMVALIFDVIAAGGRILNKVFSWLGTAGKFLLDIVTFGNADNVIGGVNSFIGGTRDVVRGIAADETKAGPQVPPAPASTQVNVYTGDSRSGTQRAFDEVARRAARTMPANSYSGIVV